MINIGNRTLCRPIRSVIILVIKQIIRFPLCSRPILSITCMIKDRIGRHEFLLPLQIDHILWENFKNKYLLLFHQTSLFLKQKKSTLSLIPKASFPLSFYSKWANVKLWLSDCNCADCGVTLIATTYCLESDISKGCYL